MESATPPTLAASTRGRTHPAKSFHLSAFPTKSRPIAVLTSALLHTESASTTRKNKNKGESKDNSKDKYKDRDKYRHNNMSKNTEEQEHGQQTKTRIRARTRTRTISRTKTTTANAQISAKPPHATTVKPVGDFSFFFTSTFQLLNKLWSQVSPLLPARFRPSIFIAHRVQQSHCSSIFHRVLLTHALGLSRKSICAQEKPLRICMSMHSGELILLVSQLEALHVMGVNLASQGVRAERLAGHNQPQNRGGGFHASNRLSGAEHNPLKKRARSATLNAQAPPRSSAGIKTCIVNTHGLVACPAAESARKKPRPPESTIPKQKSAYFTRIGHTYPGRFPGTPTALGVTAERPVGHGQTPNLGQNQSERIPRVPFRRVPSIPGYQTWIHWSYPGKYLGIHPESMRGEIGATGRSRQATKNPGKNRSNLLGIPAEYVVKVRAVIPLTFCMPPKSCWLARCVTFTLN